MSEEFKEVYQKLLKTKKPIFLRQERKSILKNSSYQFEKILKEETEEFD